MQDAVDEFVTAYRKQAEWAESDEYIDESILVNNYEFTEDGEQY